MNPTVRFPGRIFQQFVERAETEVLHGGDVDLADTISRSRVVKRGRGYQAHVALTADEADRLAYWLPEKHRGDMFAMAEQLRSRELESAC